MCGADLPADIDAAAIREPGIEERDVGSNGGMRRNASPAVAASPTMIKSSVVVRSSASPRRTNL
jgi:hypothetical protein